MYQAFIKRMFDLILTSLLLVLLFPLLLFIAILIRLFLSAPILFCQERIGYQGKPFKLYKFRTMLDKRDAQNNLLGDAERMTTFGKLLRSFSLDELPELINILKGDMSLVGPRPLLPEYLPYYSARQLQRHETQPGITGWAQINGRNTVSWEKRFELDLWYVEHVSFLLDIKILLLTFVKTLRREGINEEGQVTMSRFDADKRIK